MARYQFREDPADGASAADRYTSVMQLCVRVIGIVLILIGLAIGIRVIAEAWGLYKHPERIGYFVTAIEKGSNLDEFEFSRPIDDGDASTPSPQPFRIAYFAAWAIAVLLLLLVGRLAMTAISVGGHLALYDVRIKQFAKELIKNAGAMDADGRR